MRYGVLVMLLSGCIDWASLYESRCGNERLEGDEQCDDGNADDTDACLSSCRFATCGDGHVRAKVEDCDDGNRDDGDGCSNSCVRCNAGNENFVFAESGACFSRFDQPLGWVEAEQRCDAASGYLATFLNSHEAMAVEDALLTGTQTPAWIGMRDQYVNGTYAWVSAEPLQGAKWGRGEPSGPLGACAVVERDGANWVWATLPCDRPNPYLCKRSPFLIRPETGHAYIALFAQLSWEEARVTCEKRGAHLATITDAAEQNFVARLAPGEFWIGGRDDALDGSFTWSTAEPALFSAFAPGEPDHDAGAQCLLMGVDEGWHDRPCANGNAYVCEVEP